MGIQNLLPQLKSITSSIHVRELAGSKVAVDAYSWLHRAAYMCAVELAHGHFTTQVRG